MIEIRPAPIKQSSVRKDTLSSYPPERYTPASPRTGGKNSLYRAKKRANCHRRGPIHSVDALRG
jgi:hypothetical protein